MAEILPGTIIIKCNAKESSQVYNDIPQSGLIDQITRTEIMTYTN